MKTAIYFPVTTNNYTTPKSLDIRMNYGWSGYGIYFALLQKLAATESRAFRIDDANTLAFDLHCTIAELTPIINNYFESDGEIFYSEDLTEWLGYYDDKYNKASEGGKKAAAGMTPEQRKDRARKAAKAKHDKVIDDAKELAKPAKELAEVDYKNEDMLTTKQELLTPLEDSANNRIEQHQAELNLIEKNRTKQNLIEPNKKESQPLGSSSVLGSDTTSKPVIVKDNFDILRIQEEIHTYTKSQFFTSNQLEYVKNLFIEFRKQYQFSKIDLEKFETVLFFYLFQASEYPSGINDFLDTSPTVDLNNIQLTIKLLNEHQEIRDNYFQVINARTGKISKPKLDVITQPIIETKVIDEDQFHEITSQSTSSLSNLTPLENTKKITFKEFEEKYPPSPSQLLNKLNHECMLLPNGRRDVSRSIEYSRIMLTAENFQRLLSLKYINQETVDRFKKDYYNPTEEVQQPSTKPETDENSMFANHDKIVIKYEESPEIDKYSDLPI